jgi:hypothetical protein
MPLVTFYSKITTGLSLELGIASRDVMHART